MKKRHYLTSIAALAAAIALDAGAAIPKSESSQPLIGVELTVPGPEIVKIGTPFVLHRPILTGTSQAKHSYHSSHGSHSSHSSHHSSRY